MDSRKSGCQELFLRVFPAKIPVKRREAVGEPRVARRSQSRHLSNAPGPAGQLAASRKDSAREAPDVGFRRSWYRRKACATFSCKVLDLWETKLGTEIYGPANRGRRSVFWSIEGHFSDRRFRLDRGKPWRSESSTLCMNVSSFQRARACGSTCCEPGRLCAQARQYVAPDVGFRRSWCRRKACATYFLKVPALLRGEFGFARYDLVNRGRWNVPCAKGSFFDRDSGLTGGALDDPGVGML
uniref:Uncharacterized protein n=1 Tax=Fagus sylvatica TaxID=28930 RepID=A0A2N9GFJ4_FAGSY